MSDKGKSGEANAAETNSTGTKSNTQSKKKERRSKGNKEALNAENTTTSNEKQKAMEKVENLLKLEQSEAGTSNASAFSETQLKALLDEAYSYKANAGGNILPLLRDAAKTPQEAMQKSFKFWSTQPVPKFDEKIEQNEAIEPDKTIAEIRADPYALPDGFKWETMNLNDPLVLTELYTLLNENYVEDDDAMFRFDYQPEFLKWALQPPGWRAGKIICLNKQ